VRSILIINSGGTFNKVYNRVTGELEIDKSGKAIEQIANGWLTEFKVINVVGKDSLDMTQSDRAKIAETINSAEENKIILVHGTDTMHLTAQYLSRANLDKRIVLTGAMTPFSINPIEATANLSSAYGYLLQLKENNVYISMNSRIDLYKRVTKNREKGYFQVTL
jgi:L-asparaginase